MISLSIQTLIIIILVTFIIGLIFGVSLSRPKNNYTESHSNFDISDEVSIKLTKEQLGKTKRLSDGKEVVDLTKWKPPNDTEIKIDWEKFSRDLEKKQKGKYD